MTSYSRSSTFSCSASSRAGRSGRTLKPITVAFDTAARSTSDFVIPPTPRSTNDSRTSSCSWSSLRSASVSASSEPCMSAFTRRFSVATSPRCTIAKMSSRRAPPASIIGCERFDARRRCARASATTRATFSFGATRSSSPASGRVVEPEHLDRGRRTGLGDRVAALVEHRPDLAPAAARDDRLADAEGAPLDERGDDGTPPGVEVRLEHERPRRRLRVGAQLLLELRVGDEEEAVEQLLDPDARRCGDVEDERVAAPLLGHELLLRELLAHARRVGVLAVGLGDRDDDRHLGRLGVVDRLDRLRHHAVVGRDHEDRDVGRLGATGAHGGERLVARGVDEGDLPAVALDLVGADGLGDAAGLAGGDVGVADRVEQRGLAVVDVTHHGHDRRTRLEQRLVVFLVLTEHGLQLELGLLAGLDEQDLGAELLRDELDHLVGERLRAR